MFLSCAAVFVRFWRTPPAYRRAGGLRMIKQVAPLSDGPMRSRDHDSSVDVRFYKTTAISVCLPEEGLVSSHVAPSALFQKIPSNESKCLFWWGGSAIRNRSALSL